MSYEIQKWSCGKFEPVIYQTMLEAALDNRIFSVQCADGKIALQEECDGNFVMDITPNQLRALGEELIALANVEISHAPSASEQGQP